MVPRIEYLIRRLREEDRALAEQLAALDPAAWSVQVYSEPDMPWAVRDVLAHLLSAERGLLRLMADIATGGQGAPPGFDYLAYNHAEVAAMADCSPADMIRDLRKARAGTIDLVERLDDEDLDRMGRHPALGGMPLEDFIKTVYRHARIHWRDVQRALQ